MSSAEKWCWEERILHHTGSDMHKPTAQVSEINEVAFIMSWHDYIWLNLINRTEANKHGQQMESWWHNWFGFCTMYTCQQLIGCKMSAQSEDSSHKTILHCGKVCCLATIGGDGWALMGYSALQWWTDTADIQTEGDKNELTPDDAAIF